MKRSGLAVFVMALFLTISTQAETTGAKFSEGLKLFQGKNYDDALLVFKEITIAATTNAQANFYVGRCYKELGNIDLAAKYLARAIELEPKNTQFRAFAEIVLEIAPTPVPTPAPKRVWIKDRHQLNGRFLALGIIAAIGSGVALYDANLSLSITANDKQSLNVVGIAGSLVSLVFFLNSAELVPAHWENLDGSMIQIQTEYADLDLLKFQFNPVNSKVNVDLATVHF